MLYKTPQGDFERVTIYPDLAGFEFRHKTIVFLHQVFYLDYGNCEWVSEHDIRQMEPQFMHLAFQAVECFLPLEPTSADGKWTPEGRAAFKQLTDSKVLFAKVLSR